MVHIHLYTSPEENGTARRSSVPSWLASLFVFSLVVLEWALSAYLIIHFIRVIQEL